MRGEEYRVVISATSEGEAQAILSALLKQKLVAGGLITSGLSNHWWKKKIVEKTYWNVSCFTVATHKHKICDVVCGIHKDKTPIIAFFKVDYGNEKFLDWVSETTS